MTLTAKKTRVFYAPDGDKRLTINIKKELHKRLKIAAVDNNTTAGELIESMIAGSELMRVNNDADTVSDLEVISNESHCDYLASLEVIYGIFWTQDLIGAFHITYSNKKYVYYPKSGKWRAIGNPTIYRSKSIKHWMHKYVFRDETN